MIAYRGTSAILSFVMECVPVVSVPDVLVAAFSMRAACARGSEERWPSPAIIASPVSSWWHGDTTFCRDANTSVRGGHLHLRPHGGDRGYAAMSAAMEALAEKQPGFLGLESARGGDVGITVSYWTDDEAARKWKQVAAHLVAQRRGREIWYEDYRVRVATVERDYSLRSSARVGLHGPGDPDPEPG